MDDMVQERVEAYTFRMVMRPQPSKLEASMGYLIFFLFLAPIVAAIFTQEPICLLALLLGFLAIWIFNLATGGKFMKSELIKQPNFITFTERQIEIKLNGNLQVWTWEYIKDIVLYVVAYDGKYRDSDDRFDGTENNISFVCEELSYRNFFYIERDSDFEAFSTFLRNKVLARLYALRSVKNESLLISKLTYEELQVFKQENDINRYTDQIYFN